MAYNSDKYADIDTEEAKKLGTDTLRKMAANCQPAYGVMPGSPVANQGKDEKYSAPTDAPK